MEAQVRSLTFCSLYVCVCLCVGGCSLDVGVLDKAVSFLHVDMSGMSVKCLLHMSIYMQSASQEREAWML